MTKSLRAPMFPRRALMASTALVAASLAVASPSVAQQVSLNGVDQTRTTLAGITSVENGAETNATLTVDLDTDETFAGPIVDGNRGGRLFLTKIGNGDLVLTADNAFTGETTINAGTLVFDGGSTSLDLELLVAEDVGSDGAAIIRNGGEVANRRAFIGLAPGSTGEVTVTGQGSSWTSPILLEIGSEGNGALTVADGGAVTSANANVGFYGSATGDVSIIGAGSSWTNPGSLAIGAEGTGIVTIADGGVFDSGSGTLAFLNGSVGRVTVTGEDSRWTSSGDLTVGQNGDGVLTIADGATVQASLANIALSGGSGVINIGSAAGEGPGAAGILDTDSLVFGSGDGALVFNHTEFSYDFTADISGAGTVRLLSGNTTLSGDNSYTGETILDDGTLTLATDTALGDSTLRMTGGDIIYADGVNIANSVMLESVSRIQVQTGSATQSGVISEAGGSRDFYKSADGELILTADNTWTGQTYVGFGTLTFDGGSLAQGGDMTVSHGGPDTARVVARNGAQIAAGDTLTVGDLNDGEMLLQSGAEVAVGVGVEIASGINSDGALIIGAASGQAAVEAGVLEAPRVTFGAGAGALVFNHTDVDYDFGADITGAGSISLLSGHTILSGDNSYTGETLLDDATLTLASDTALGGSTLRMTGSVIDYADGVDNGQPIIIDSNTSQFQVLTGSATQSGVVSESGGSRPLEKIGDGELVLTADNTWTGSTRVSGGTLTFDGGSLDLVGRLTAAADGAAQALIVARNGAQISTGDALVIGEVGIGEMLIESSADVTAAGAVSIGDLAGGRGILTVRGPGSSLTNGGILFVGTNDAGELVVEGGGQVASQNGIVGTLSGADGRVLLTDAGSEWINNGTIELGRDGRGEVVVADGAQLQTGSIRLGLSNGASGVLTIGDGGAAGVVDVSDGYIRGGRGAGIVRFDHTGGAYAFTSNGNTRGRSNLITDNVSVEHVGTGATTLVGAHTYTGTTTVSAGFLLIDGSLTNEGGVTVEDGGTLMGTGGIGGLTTVESGGAVRGIGGAALKFDDLLLMDGAEVEAVLGMLVYTAAFDVAGDLTLDGTLNVINAGAFEPGVYRLFDYHGGLTDNGLEIGDGDGAPVGALTIQMADQGQINLVYAASEDLLFWDGTGPANDGLIQGGSGAWTQTSETWTNADGDVNGPMTPQPGFAVFSAAPGTVTADDTAGALEVTGLQFAVDGYTLTGDLVTLVEPSAGAASTLRVGDGTGAGADMTATIAGDFAATSDVTKTDGGRVRFTGASDFSGSLAVADGTLSLDGGAMAVGSEFSVAGGFGRQAFVENGGALTADAVSVSGVLRVRDPGSSLETNSLTATRDGSVISASNGGSIEVDGTIQADGDVGQAGFAQISAIGSGSSLIGSGDLIAGLSASGEVTANGDSSVTAVRARVGQNAGSEGRLFAGAGGSLTFQELLLGEGGSGELLVQAGGVVSVEQGPLGDGDLTVAVADGSYGRIDIEGDGRLDVDGVLRLGVGDIAGIAVEDDGVLETGSAIFGVEDGTSGSLSLSGGTWTNAETLLLGQSGEGGFSVRNGGVVTTGQTTLGSAVDGTGFIVSAEGASVTIDGDLVVGDQGRGLVLVYPDGVLTAGETRGAIGAASEAEITAFGGTLNLDSLTLSGQGDGFLLLTDNGVLNLDGGAGVLTLTGAADGYGALTIGGERCGCTPGAFPFTPGTLNAAEVVFGPGTGELYFNHTETNYVFDAELTGDGLVTALAGTTVLTADSAGFSGDVLVTGADTRLFVDGALGTVGDGGQVAVADGGYLGGSGVLNGTVAIDDGGILQGRSGQTLALGGLVLGADAVVEAALGSPSATSLFDIGDDLTLDGTLNVTDAGGFGAGIYRLFDYGGDLTDNGLDLGDVPAGTALSNLSVQTSVASQINLVVANSGGGDDDDDDDDDNGGGPDPDPGPGPDPSPGLSFWDGAGPANDGRIQGGTGTWSLGGTAWTRSDGRVNAAYDNPSYAVFAGTGGQVMVSGSGIGVTGMQFATDGYVISGDAIALTQAETVVRVGDGTAAGADMTATIASSLTGSGALVKTDLGTLILTGVNSYGGGTVVRNGLLVGGLGSIAGNVDIASGAGLAFDIDEAGAFAGVVSGRGDLIKSGDGELALTGDSSDFAGTTQINEGLLRVNGALGGEIRLGVDGALAGSGTLGSLLAGAGSIISPGNSIGTLAVAGNVTFEPGSTYLVEVDPTSDAADRIVAGGVATLNGGTVRHFGVSGEYRPESTYTILTAAGGVTGRFDAIQTDFAFLDAELGYQANSVQMTLTRNDVAFPAVGQSFNQRSTAAAVEATGRGAPLYDAVIGQSEQGARMAFDALSGDLHGSLRSMQSEAAGRLAGGLIDRLEATETDNGPGVWAQATGSRTRLATDGNAASLTDGAGGLVLGGDASVGGFRLGVAAAASRHAYDSDARASSAEGDSLSLAAYGSGRWGPLRLSAGVTGTWHEVESERVVAFPGFVEMLRADYDAETVQAFVEASWRVDVSPSTTLSPFVNVARVRTETDGFTETGGEAALTVQSGVQTTDLATAGLGLRRAFDQGGGRAAVFSGRLGWRHAWGGDRSADVRQAFASAPGGADFAVRGLPITDDALVAEVGLEVELQERLSLTVDWSGQFASDLAANSLAAKLSWRF